MLSRIIAGLILLFVVILVVGFVAKLLKFAIGLAFVVGVIAVILYITKKKE